MKKRLIAILMVFCIVGFAFGQGKSAVTKTASKTKGETTSLTNPGNLLASAGIGFGGLAGGAEFMLAQVSIADVVPITFGVAARAFVDPGIFYTTFSSFTFGAGGFGTAHVGFKKIHWPEGLVWVSNFDVYMGLGLGFGTATANNAYSGYTVKPGIGVSTFEGTSYYFNDRLALTAEYGYIGQVSYDFTYWAGYSVSTPFPLYYSTIGLTFKL